MGQIIAAVEVGNAAPQGGSKRVAMLVDTGATHLTLPLAWKPQFGAFETEQVVLLETPSCWLPRARHPGPCCATSP